MTRTALPGDRADRQSRYIEAAIDGILVGCIYLPNGNPQPGPKFDYKLKWFKRLAKHSNSLLAENIPVVLAGDFNVAPTERDIYPTKSWDKDALVQPESREGYRRLVARGGPTRCAIFTPTKRSIRFGITCVIAGKGMPV